MLEFIVVQIFESYPKVVAKAGFFYKNLMILK